MKGIGYEFEPVVVVVDKSKNTKISLDLNSFDNPSGTFEIYNNDTGDSVTSFQGKKGVVNVDTEFSKIGTYLIVKDNNTLAVIDVQDDISKTDLETIRSKYLK
jgi:Uncharacterized protein conserved in bacteria